ncbi:MAG: hypothetical protein NZM04_09660 [Methylacidiphilales bacterium]|nr:hypothetical protein [Candidatus Methylacidiphilales bacterium]
MITLPFVVHEKRHDRHLIDHPSSPADPTLCARLERFLFASKADATHRAYATAWREFDTFCRANGYETLRVPNPVKLPVMRTTMAGIRRALGTYSYGKAPLLQGVSVEQHLHHMYGSKSSSGASKSSGIQIMSLSLPNRRRCFLTDKCSAVPSSVTMTASSPSVPPRPVQADSPRLPQAQLAPCAFTSALCISPRCHPVAAM